MIMWPPSPRINRASSSPLRIRRKAIGSRARFGRELQALQDYSVRDGCTIPTPRQCKPHTRRAGRRGELPSRRCARVLHQNVPGRVKGDRIVVGESPLPLNQASAISSLSRGHTVDRSGRHPSHHSKTVRPLTGGHRLNNVALHTVEGIRRRRRHRFDQRLDDCQRALVHLDARLRRHQAMRAQGKTVDVCLIGQSSASFPASSSQEAVLRLRCPVPASRPRFTPTTRNPCSMP